MRIRNKGTGEIFTSLSSFALDAQKRYALMDNLVYCDVECMLKDPDPTDETSYYVLDECGNWAYFPSDLYEVIP